MKNKKRTSFLQRFLCKILPNDYFSKNFQRIQRKLGQNHQASNRFFLVIVQKCLWSIFLWTRFRVLTSQNFGSRVGSRVQKSTFGSGPGSGPICFRSRVGSGPNSGLSGWVRNSDPMFNSDMKKETNSLCYAVK